MKRSTRRRANLCWYLTKSSGNITYQVLRDLLARRCVAPVTSNDKTIPNSNPIQKRIDETETFDCFSSVLGFRRRKASRGQGRVSVSDSDSDSDSDTETQAGEGDLHREWKQCDAESAFEFRTTEDGRKILLAYRQANSASSPSSANYIDPPIDDALDRYPLFVALEQLRNGGIEMMHLLRIRRQDPKRVEDMDEEGYQAIVAEDLSMEGSCVITDCDMNASTVDEDGELLRQGLHEEKIPSPYNSEEVVCPMHFAILYVCQALNLQEEEAKQVIAWGVGQAALFSLARKWGILLRCPYGCNSLLGQAKNLVGKGDSVVFSGIGCCRTCSKHGKEEMKRQRKVMEEEIKQFELKNESWTRDQLTSFRSPELMVPRITRCSVTGCTRMLMLTRDEDWQYCKTQTLSPEGHPICAPHFIGYDATPLAIRSKHSWISLDAQDVTIILNSLVERPTEQNLSDLARERKVLPRGLWFELSKFVKKQEGVFLDVQGWNALEEAFGEAKE